MIGSYSIMEIRKDELGGTNGDEVVRKKLKEMIENLNKKFIEEILDSLLIGKNQLELKLLIYTDSLMRKLEPVIPGMPVDIDRTKSLLRIDLIKEDWE